MHKIDLPQNQLNHLEQQNYAFSSSTSAYLKHFDKAISSKKGAISNSYLGIDLGDFYNTKNTVINIADTFAYRFPTQNYNNDPLFLYNECPATTVNLNTAYSVGNLPAGTNLTWHTSLPATNANKMADVSTLGSGIYYAAFYDATNDCYGDNGMATLAINVKIISCTTINNECPATTVNLNTAYSVSNLPADASLTWHTSLPATNANKMANASAVGSGTYYAAFYDATNDCYPDNGMSATAVNVELVPCGEICDNGIDDDGDGAIDCADGDCANYEPLTLMDDNYATCPGFLIERFLKSNDVVTANAVYLLKQAPTKGVAVVQENGIFSYNSSLTDCLDDSFVYQVCDTLTGCCAEATVFIDLSDTERPQLDNLPEDETVHCDEILPTIPSVFAFD
ncbi:MAG: hypothetical protein AB8G86_04075, partial [Saprospiraceae bacterium]